MHSSPKFPIKNFYFANWTVPIALLALCVLSFGLLAPWLGFFWDDWPTIWYLHLLGPAGFRDVFTIDRPLLGWLFIVTTSVLGESTLAWQLFGLFTRWLCCLALWWLLRLVWPSRERETGWAAFLFAVYPGFTQQSISVTYSNGWIILAAFFLSLGMMVRAARKPAFTGWAWMAASWLLAAATVFTSEYYFGLELLRPALLWLAVKEQAGEGRKRLVRTALYWAPYLAILAVFLYWRIVVHETPRGEVKAFGYLLNSPLGTALDLARTVLEDVVQSSLIAWAQVFDFRRWTGYGQGPTALYLAVVLASVPLAVLYLVRFRTREMTSDRRPPTAGQATADGRRVEYNGPTAGVAVGQAETTYDGQSPAAKLAIEWASARSEIRTPTESSEFIPSARETAITKETATSDGRPAPNQTPGGREKPIEPIAGGQPSAAGGRYSWPVQSILLGLLALLLGGIPFWTTYLPIELRFPWDRFTLSMMLGASLLLAGLLSLLPERRGLRAAVLGLLIGLAVGAHVQQANLYRREWNAQKEFFWQLTWRAPAVQPGTALLTAELPFTVFSDNSLTAPLNWIYAPGSASRQMPYLFYAVESRLKTGLPRLEKGIAIEQPYRATAFSGSTDQALAVFFEPPGCVKVVDPLVDARLPQKPNFIDELLPLSKPALITANPAVPASPPEHIFGPEPEHGWCYFFEKADLARQQGDWQEVVSLGEQAFRLETRLYEVNAAELVPYIEGYARTGRWERAQELSIEAHRLTFRMKRMLCAAWERIELETPQSAGKQTAIEGIRSELKCSAR